MPKFGPKIVLWDLETTNLNANFGYLLCFGWKILGEKKTNAISITEFPQFKKDPTNDRSLVKAAYSELANADAWVTWYGSRFDVPYLSSRLLYHKLPFLPPVPHIDGWWIARKHLRLNSNRLASVSSFLDIEEKTPLDGPTWIRAAAGHEKSIKYVVEHCLQDVVVLEEAYLRIRPLMRTHPNLNVISEEANVCPTCGSKKLQKRGVSITRVATRQRYMCNACGAWSKGKKHLFSAEIR